MTGTSSRLLPILLTCAILASSAAASSDDAELSSFGAAVSPVVTKYCIGCHNAQKHKGQVNLEGFGDDASILGDLKTWQKVVDILDDGSMPPADQPQPDEQESAHLLAYLQSVVSKAGCSTNADPGRVTLRRLNRDEYNNTVRDLVGLDLKPADDFPSDDVGYGFDNIGDVLTLPPLLMEQVPRRRRVRSPAERSWPTSLRRVQAREPGRGRISSDRAGTIGTLEDESGGWMLNTNAEVGRDDAFPELGSFRIRVRAFGQQAGPEPAPDGNPGRRRRRPGLRGRGHSAKLQAPTRRP